MLVPGYSGKTLAQKLGFYQGMTLHLINPPAEYQTWLGEIALGLRFKDDFGQKEIKAVHLFCRTKAELLEHLTKLRSNLAQDGFVWVSWPKKSAKVPTEITEDVIRELALPLGFVDVKVCAVSEIWSGLKRFIRKSERTILESVPR